MDQLPPPLLPPLPPPPHVLASRSHVRISAVAVAHVIPPFSVVDVAVDVVILALALALVLQPRPFKTNCSKWFYPLAQSLTPGLRAKNGPPGLGHFMKKCQKCANSGFAGQKRGESLEKWPARAENALRLASWVF